MLNRQGWTGHDRLRKAARSAPFPDVSRKFIFILINPRKELTLFTWSTLQFPDKGRPSRRRGPRTGLPLLFIFLCL